MSEIQFVLSWKNQLRLVYPLVFVQAELIFKANMPKCSDFLHDIGNSEIINDHTDA